jgi:transcription-repair coupling factor (superfamily II helicase)
MHDLEIRGAGEILGEAQSGAIANVGFALYTQMLHEAVHRLRQGKGAAPPTPDELLSAFATTAEITLGEPALLPESYCPDVAVRLDLYKRCADATSNDALNALKEELIDRFGPLPPPGETLLATHRLRLLLTPTQVRRVDATRQQITVRFAANAPVDPARVVALIQRDRSVQLKGSDTLQRTGSFPTITQRIEAVVALIAAVVEPAHAPAQP